MHGDLDSSSCSSRFLPTRMLDVASLLNQGDPTGSRSSRHPPPPLPNHLQPSQQQHRNNYQGFHGFLAPPLPPPSQLLLAEVESSADHRCKLIDPGNNNVNRSLNNNSTTHVTITTNTTTTTNNNLVEGAPELSAVTNMSNITSASGEASVSSGERGTTTAHGGSASVIQPQSHQLAVHQGGASIAATAAASGNLNSNGLTVAVKRKRNLPGTPDPEAEVIALSPKTLMATNRFVCEICNKGFQRDQNLQLHRRGHNLPWKLKQRANKEIRKKVYICPETTCVHHDPARALGDLTGIKKHFCRKHGEKKWKCDKCSKRYAVQSDWKAHSKTCGTREYRCDCGTLFSRRDSFITHRAFCDALAEESARVSTGSHGHILGGNSNAGLAALGMVQAIGAAAPPSPIRAHQAAAAIAAITHNNMDPADILLHHHNSAAINATPNPNSTRPRLSLWPSSSAINNGGNAATTSASSPYHLGQPTSSSDAHIGSSLDTFVNPSSAMASLFGPLQHDSADNYGDGPKPAVTNYSSLLMQQPAVSNLGQGGGAGGFSTNIDMSEYAGLSSFANTNRHQLTSAAMAMASNLGNLHSVSSFFNQAATTAANNGGGGAAAQMSATALLQKAAQMGATASGNSLLKGLASAAPDMPSSAWASTSAAAEHQHRAAAAAMAAQAVQNTMIPITQHNNNNNQSPIFQHQQLQNRSSPSDSMNPFGQNRSSPSDPFAGGGIRSQSLQPMASKPAVSQESGGGTGNSCSAAGIQEMLLNAANMAGPGGVMGHHTVSGNNHMFSGGSNLFGDSQRLMVSAAQQHQQQQHNTSNSNNHFYGSGGGISSEAALNYSGNMGGAATNYGKVPKSEDGITRDFLGVRSQPHVHHHHHQSGGVDQQLHLMSYHQQFNPHGGGATKSGGGDYNQQLQRLSDFSTLYSHHSTFSDHQTAGAMNPSLYTAANAAAALALSHSNSNNNPSSNHNGNSTSSNNNNSNNAAAAAAALAIISSSTASPSRRQTWDN